MLNTPLAQNIAIIAVLGIPVAGFIYWIVASAIESHRNYRNSLKGN